MLMIAPRARNQKKSERFGGFLMRKKDFESQNFVIFEEVVHNFGRTDDDIIFLSEKMLTSNRCLHGLHNAQLDQKICDSI